MPRAAATPIFYGWRIVGTAFVCHAVNVGLIFYAWGVFLAPLSAHFGSRGRVALAYSLMQVSSAAIGLAVGRVIDRHGARPAQLVGACAMAAGFWWMSRIDSLPALYACLMGPLALGATIVGGLPANAAVARWFVRRRGTALGIATAGISFGGIVFAPLSQYLIDHVGWRAACAVLGTLVIVLVVPPVALFMRRDPRDLGLWPDGIAPDHAGRQGEDPGWLDDELERSLTPGAALRTPSFWLLAGAFALTMSGIAGTLLYQNSLLIDRGFPAGRASLVLGATAAMGTLGKLGFGQLLDRFDQRRIAAACFLAQAAGVALLWLGRGPVALGLYVLLYGYAMGGNATLLASLVAEAFGRLHYGAISARLSPFVVLSQAITIPLTGYARDHSGSFAPALAAIVVACLAAVVLVLRMEYPARRPRLHQAHPSHR
jgi:MFS family permease